MENRLQKQIERFKIGFSFINLDRPATVGDGILQFSENETEELIKAYNQRQKHCSVLKFVPASGAATRMFKELYAGLELLENGKEANEATKQFAARISNFAFSEELLQQFTGDFDPTNKTLITELLKLVLTQKGTNFGAKPKAVIPFHRHNTGAESPILEHMIEGVTYAKQNDRVSIHFTISEQHEQLFKAEIGKYINRFSDVDFEISFSYQHNETNTVAVDLNNNPVLVDGNYLMRPAGHGALIENLNKVEADLIFIKNIDNVTIPELEPESSSYKKLLAEVLLRKRDQIFALIEQVKADHLNEASAFCKEELQLDLSRKEELLAALNRPIRVCGMVENTGEPGGGPFWVKQKNGSSTLQIVEKAQIDISNQVQHDILMSSTHFNPVDLVFWKKDVNGNSFDLLDYRDEETGFISEKSFEGKTIKAMELPGLWNGAMANWLTFFVEVPLSTFNPVKTVLDLLKPGHSS